MTTNPPLVSKPDDLLDAKTSLGDCLLPATAERVARSNRLFPRHFLRSNPRVGM
jgi:hypothetical protein